LRIILLRALLQPVLEKMRFEMLVETQIEILDGQISYIFSNEPKRQQKNFFWLSRFILNLLNG